MPPEPQDAAVRVRISLQAGELEIEGPQDFFDQFQDIVDTLLKRLQSTSLPTGSAAGPPHPSLPMPQGDVSAFPEILHSLPNTASGTDLILVAGWYAQKGNPDAAFATGEANRLLLDQGLKLANPSQSLTNNLKVKRVFKVGKRFRISSTGEQYLRQLVPGL